MFSHTVRAGAERRNRQDAQRRAQATKLSRLRAQKAKERGTRDTTRRSTRNTRKNAEEKAPSRRSVNKRGPSSRAASIGAGSPEKAPEIATGFVNELLTTRKRAIIEEAGGGSDLRRRRRGVWMAARRFQDLASRVRARNGFLVAPRPFGEDDGAEGSAESPKLIFTPDTPWRPWWDLFVGVLILYSVITVPFRIGFALETDTASFVLDRVIDVLFFFDLLINFRTAYHDSAGQLVTRPSKVASHYLSNWFLIDLLSTLPIDLVVEAVTGGGGSVLRSLKLIRAVRLVRLIRLVRLLKLKRFLGELEESMESVNPILIKMAPLLFQVVFMAHLLSCFWHFVGAFNEPDGASTSWIHAHGLRDASVGKRYLISMHFVITTMTSVGFGDITPQTPSERVFAIACMLAGASIFGFIIGNISALIDTVDPRTAAYKRKMTEVTEYMRDRNLPKGLRVRIRGYFEHYLKWRSVFDEAAILQGLSSALRTRVVYESYADIIRNIALFRESDRGVVSALVVHLKPLLCPARTSLARCGDVGHEMFFLYRGFTEAWFCPRPDSNVSSVRVARLIREADAGSETDVNERDVGHDTLILRTEEDEDDSLQDISKTVIKRVKKRGGELQLLLGLYSAGSHFGEVALLSQSARMMGFRALVQCEVFTLGKEDLDEFVLFNPEGHKLLVRGAYRQALYCLQARRDALEFTIPGIRDTIPVSDIESAFPSLSSADKGAIESEFIDHMRSINRPHSGIVVELEKMMRLRTEAAAWQSASTFSMPQPAGMQQAPSPGATRRPSVSPHPAQVRRAGGGPSFLSKNTWDRSSGRFPASGSTLSHTESSIAGYRATPNARVARQVASNSGAAVAMGIFAQAMHDNVSYGSDHGSDSNRPTSEAENESGQRRRQAAWFGAEDAQDEEDHAQSDGDAEVARVSSRLAQSMRSLQVSPKRAGGSTSDSRPTVSPHGLADDGLPGASDDVSNRHSRDSGASRGPSGGGEPAVSAVLPSTAAPFVELPARLQSDTIFLDDGRGTGAEVTPEFAAQIPVTAGGSLLAPGPSPLHTAASPSRTASRYAVSESKSRSTKQSFADRQERQLEAALVGSADDLPLASARSKNMTVKNMRSGSLAFPQGRHLSGHMAARRRHAEIEHAKELHDQDEPGSTRTGKGSHPRSRRHSMAAMPGKSSRVSGGRSEERRRRSVARAEVGSRGRQRAEQKRIKADADHETGSGVGQSKETLDAMSPRIATESGARDAGSGTGMPTTDTGASPASGDTGAVMAWGPESAIREEGGKTRKASPDHSRLHGPPSAVAGRGRDHDPGATMGVGDEKGTLEDSDSDETEVHAIDTVTSKYDVKSLRGGGQGGKTLRREMTNLFAKFVHPSSADDEDGAESAAEDDILLPGALLLNGRLQETTGTFRVQVVDALSATTRRGSEEDDNLVGVDRFITVRSRQHTLSGTMMQSGRQSSLWVGSTLASEPNTRESLRDSKTHVGSATPGSSTPPLESGSGALRPARKKRLSLVQQGSPHYRKPQTGSSASLEDTESPDPTLRTEQQRALERWKLGLCPCFARRRLVEDDGLQKKVKLNGAAVVSVRPDLYEEAEETMQEVQQRRIIHPGNSRKTKWDLAMAALILYSTVVIPFRICFGVDAEGGAFVFDVVVDILFATDVLVNFRTAYYADSVLVTVPSLIAGNYLRTWFAIDILSTLPIDLVVRLATGESGALRSLKLIRSVRLIRLVKLVRVLKLQRFISIVEETLFISPAVVRLFKLFFQVAFVAHLIACFWFYVSVLGSDGSRDAWWIEDGLADADVWTLYLASIYFTLSTFTTTGFGDIVPDKDNVHEVIFTLVAMLCGATVFGYVVGGVASLVGRIDAAANRAKEKMDEVKSYMREHNVSKSTRIRVRKHFEYVLERKSAFDEAGLLSELSESLRQELVTFLNKDIISRVPFFEGQDIGFTSYAVSLMKPEFHYAGDDIFVEGQIGNEMYFLVRGEVHIVGPDKPAAIKPKPKTTSFVSSAFLKPLLAGKEPTEDESSGPRLYATVQEGDAFGEIAVLMSAKRTATARAARTCHCYVLTRHDLHSMMALYPSLARRVEILIRVRIDQMRKSQMHMSAEHAGHITQQYVDATASQDPGSVLDSAQSQKSSSQTRHRSPAEE